MAQLRSLSLPSPPPSYRFLCSASSRIALLPRASRFSCSASSSSPAWVFPGNEPSSSSAIPTDPYKPPEASSNGGGAGAGSHNGRGGGGGGGGGGDGRDAGSYGGFLGAFMKGWRDRVKTDPQFPFKVLMEELVGVSASVIGDMASRPNFGLNELDFVFSTVVVGSILNFTLMYMLAPISAGAAAASLPSIFATCPPGHMFEHGAYSALDRLGTFVYKGTVFAAAGFAAGLVGTFISNALISLRKILDPTFEPQNKAPPTVLNAATWALHMGLSSNLRYQALNGLEFAMANGLHPTVFKASVVVTRGMNNILGGVSFVSLARLTGSQKSEEQVLSTIEPTKIEEASPVAATDGNRTLTKDGEPTLTNSESAP